MNNYDDHYGADASEQPQTTAADISTYLESIRASILNQPDLDPTNAEAIQSLFEQIQTVVDNPSHPSAIRSKRSRSVSSSDDSDSDSYSDSSSDEDNYKKSRSKSSRHKRKHSKKSSKSSKRRKSRHSRHNDSFSSSDGDSEDSMLGTSDSAEESDNNGEYHIPHLDRTHKYPYLDRALRELNAEAPLKSNAVLASDATARGKSNCTAREVKYCRDIIKKIIPDKSYRKQPGMDLSVSWSEQPSKRKNRILKQITHECRNKFKDDRIPPSYILVSLKRRFNNMKTKNKPPSDDD